MHDCSGSGIATGYSPPQSDIYTNHFVTPKARENTFDFYHFYPIWEGSRWKNRADCNYLNLQMPSKRKAFNILQCKSFGVQFKTIFLIFVQGLELTRGSKSRHMSRYVQQEKSRDLFTAVRRLGHADCPQRFDCCRTCHLQNTLRSLESLERFEPSYTKTKCHWKKTWGHPLFQDSDFCHSSSMTFQARVPGGPRGSNS